ncbi:family 43 glycosylhydrolase [bacterium]|nr:family 43 glycosylhydrolase [bacterium]
MKKSYAIFIYFLSVWINGYGQSPSFNTYINPVIPGDHPDPTLTKIGNCFYTSGSSFNPTPKIYYSTDLVHWEVIAQPVSASWSQYGDNPGSGIWGGHMVLYNDIYWHYFGKGSGSMYFVTADRPEGPWSDPTVVKVPAGVPEGLGVDNSIFIDEDTNKWYLLSKHLPRNNHIVELGVDGQPNGNVLDLTWLNPDDKRNPYGWAEGPVMWKYNGYYYYSFAQHLVGEQYVMRSEILTDDESEWTIKEGAIFTGSRVNFSTPNHISPVVILDDGTSWTIAHSYHSSSWYAQGRQGLLCQVTYDENDWPVIQYPSANSVPAPVLPSSGIPWTVPKSDLFNTSELKPEWSLLGYTPDDTYSLNERAGWLSLEPYKGCNTVIQNDGEHCYSLITRMDFDPESNSDEAGLWIINGPETHHAKVFSTQNQEGKNVFAFSFEDTRYDSENKIGSIVWLKLDRKEHMISGYYSAEGIAWMQIGQTINAPSIDIHHDTPETRYNNFTGNQQGLYVEGKSAFFDLYVYKDAYSPINADSPANQYGTSRKYTSDGYVLGDIHVNDWAMYAGVEFGNADYDKIPDSIMISAGSTTPGGCVEIWVDSLDTGEKIAECLIDDTGSMRKFQTFSSDVKTVTGQHDVYLKFTGTETDELFQVQSLYFKAEGDTLTMVPDRTGSIFPQQFSLRQNFPNPFNPSTRICFNIPEKSFVTIKVFDLLGREVEELTGKEYDKGKHTVTLNASHLSSGIYFYTMRAKEFLQTKKMFILK